MYISSHSFHKCDRNAGCKFSIIVEAWTFRWIIIYLYTPAVRSWRCQWLVEFYANCFYVRSMIISSSIKECPQLGPYNCNESHFITKNAGPLIGWSSTYNWILRTSLTDFHFFHTHFPYTNACIWNYFIHVTFIYHNILWPRNKSG